MVQQWKVPFEIVTDRARANVESFIPEEPNAIRVRYSGGTQGVTGEVLSAVTEETPIAIFITRKKRPRKEERFGEVEEDEFNAFFNDDLLKNNDVIKWQGRTLEVKSIGEPELNGEVVFRRATLKKKQR